MLCMELSRPGGPQTKNKEDEERDKNLNIAREFLKS